MQTQADAYGGEDARHDNFAPARNKARRENPRTQNQNTRPIMARNLINKRTSKRKQTFSISAPEAGTVQLAGCFTQWQERPVNLQKQDDGSWRATLELAPGTYQYRFLVDGQWQDDPQSGARVPNPYGTENAVLQIA
jgi:1,4-alpha-glucan branching enzyme